MRSVAWNSVSPGFFTTLGIPLISGRGLQESDARREGILPVVVSRAMAREFWNGENPLGKTLHAAGFDMEVVGVARDLTYQQPGQLDGPMLYVPWDPENNVYSTFARFQGSEDLLSRTMTADIRKESPGVFVVAGTIQHRLDQGVALVGMVRKVFGVLATVAIILAVTGIYGVVAFAMRRRPREIGLRIAFGASKGDIYRLVFESSLRPVAAGLVAGLSLTALGGMAFARINQGEALLPIDSRDPLAYLAVAVLLICVALVAMVNPARRAAHASPVEALREE
jgi:hypothetical protein